jgi:hypothetical protein
MYLFTLWILSGSRGNHVRHHEIDRVVNDTSRPRIFPSVDADRGWSGGNAAGIVTSPDAS